MKHLSDDEYLYGNDQEQKQAGYENPSIDETLDETEGFEYEDKEHLHQPSKYDIALGKYNTALDDADVAEQTAQLLEKHLEENNTPEVKKFLFNCIDLTTLKCTDSEESVMKFTERVNDFVDAYPDLKNVAAICVYPNMAEIDKMDMLHGRFINQVDINENRKVLVLSETNAKELEPHDCGRLIGQQVKVDNIAFQVVGIYDNDESEMNDVVYTPFTTLRILYNKGDRADRFMFSFHGLESEEENEAFEDAYRRTINANHQAAPEDEETIWIWNRFLNNMQMNQGMSIIRTALWIIGIFTLLSGIVGVSNIMLISVKERTREFGIRKAIGAKPLSILKLIIVESVIITTFFGYIGMVIGIAANQYMDATIGHEQTDTGLFKTTLFVNPTVGLDVCVEATLVMIIAGTLAGLIPARKAAHIRPIEALRAE